MIYADPSFLCSLYGWDGNTRTAQATFEVSGHKLQRGETAHFVTLETVAFDALDGAIGVQAEASPSVLPSVLSPPSSVLSLLSSVFRPSVFLPDTPKLV